jgi:hypothetical protein
MYAVLLLFFSGKNVMSSCCSDGFCSSLKSCRRSLLVEDDANEKEEDEEAFRNERDSSKKARLCPRPINDDNINIFSFFFFEGGCFFTFFSETNDELSVVESN